MASRNAQVSKRYKKQSHLEHIKERPDTYIGSCQARREHMWVVNAAGHMKKREITYVPGLLKIFDEILVNAADNKQRDPNMKNIKVTLQDNSITVENDGFGIPVEMHAEHNIYIPQMVFGELLTGDNYDDSEERVVGGRNGYGAKLANIFSTSFAIETVDSKSKKKYAQTWSDNMSKVSTPKITSSQKRKDYTRVTFLPDYVRFGLQHLDEDHRDLFRKRVYDVAGTSGVHVSLNGKRLHVKNFKQYCDLYVSEGKELVYEKLNDRWEVCVTMAPDQQPEQVSFCNSICTTKGGQHVQYVTNAIAQGLTPLKAFKDLNVRPFMVARSMFVFVNALITNPSFDSQTKETLTTRSSQFGPAKYKPIVPPQFVKRIVKKSGIVEDVAFYAKAKSQRNLEKKTGGTKKRNVVGIPKLDDASLAGGKRSAECTLILTEGDSAKALAIAGLSVIGRSTFGAFPLKGKLLNVRDAGNKAVIQNSEIQNIMKIMGLNIGTKYTDVSKLRYGHIMIMTDQDHDGSHIKGLIINFIHHFWPELLQIPNFLQVFITPIVKCTKGREVKTFYTTPEFYAWQQAEPRKRWKIKYYKGLGTSSAAEAKEYFSNLSKHRIPFHQMKSTGAQLIDLCFNKKRSKDRKDWIGQYSAGTHVNFHVDQMAYEDFVNKEYVIMAIQSNLRGIPHVMDGLKPSQRKVLFSCLKRKLHEEIKVAQLAGYTSEHAAYHHGEASLNSTIINMAQNFVGSNNINLLKPNGQFGTRLLGGKDAASPRYVFTQLSDITENIYHPSDAPLYEYLKDDGQSIEPAYYVPVIPMLLVNGGCGIGTGWSTSIPPHNPRDIIRNIRNMLNGQSPTPMLPWYQGFQGKIIPHLETGKIHIQGTYHWKTATQLHVTELPIGTWTNTYKEKMERSIEGYGDFKKGDILSITNQYTDTTVSFVFKLSTTCAKKMQASEQTLIKAFRLESVIDFNNMHAFDSSGNMKCYANTIDILKEYFGARMEMYNKRYAHLVQQRAEALKKISNKVRFLEIVVSGEFQFKGRRRHELMNDLDARNFAKYDNTYDYLLNVSLWNLTTEKLDALRHERTVCQQNLQTIQSYTPKKLWLDDLMVIEGSLPSAKRSIESSSSASKRSKIF